MLEPFKESDMKSKFSFGQFSFEVSGAAIQELLKFSYSLWPRQNHRKAPMKEFTLVAYQAFK